MNLPHLSPLSTSSGLSAHSLTEQLETLHHVVSSRYPDIDRVAIALYEPRDDRLKTFASSNRNGQKLSLYEATLSQVPSLAELAAKRQSRVIDDLAQSADSADGRVQISPHSEWLRQQGYRSSFTVPIFNGDGLCAFIFFDSQRSAVFDAATIDFLEIFANLIAQLYLLQMKMIDSLVGTVQLASGLARIRDLETGEHLDRMAAYSRLMARALAPAKGLSDEYIEYVSLFASLHDIGKVGIPDRVLLKPGELDEDEWVVMRQHVEIGVRIIDQMQRDTGLGNALARRIMHNIVADHHERGDGSGYPRGLHMHEIPLEARIIATADVYDALTHRRPYKHPWDEARVELEMSRQAALGQLDADCVQALLAAREERLQISRRYAED